MAVLKLHDIHRIKRWDNMDMQQISKTWDKLEDIGRFMIDMKIRLGNKHGNFSGIKDMWKNEPCFIVGAGANLNGFDLQKLNNYHTIGINHMIENYDGFEWFIFLDNRFLKRTTYNIDNYKGKIFSSNKCIVLPDHLDWYRFKIKHFHANVDLNIENGLFNGALTGLCALNLALISGANPIYMLGCDTILVKEGQSYHYQKNGNHYTGEINTEEKRKKYVRAMRYHEKFKPFADRIINVGAGVIPTFKRISLKEFEEQLINIPKKIESAFITKKPIKKRKENTQKIIVNQNPTICHMITMSDINQMGDISRQIYDLSYGNHIYCNINNPPPKADIYLLECFINGYEKYVNFQKPYANSKVISIIHSSGTCQPAKCSDQVVSLTYGWQEVLKRKGITSIAIPAGIDISKYNKDIDYNKKYFGRITRWSSGKVHFNFNKIVQDILNKYNDSKCFIISNNARKINHERIQYIENIQIDEHDKKVNALSQFCVFADYHNTFQETFSLGLLEHMASGHACILYSVAPQPSMWEILGDNGIICNSEQMFIQKLNDLLLDYDMKKDYGEKAKLKAKTYSINRMINSYDQLFKNVLK